MKYRTEQTYETLGMPCDEMHDALEAAEIAAESLRDDIAHMVAGWEVAPAATAARNEEEEAWERAEDMADGEHYGMDAGRHIASYAVRITAIED